MACHQVCKRNLLEWAMIGGRRLAQSNSLFVAVGPAQDVFFDPQGCGESSRAVAFRQDHNRALISYKK